jgi:hypothetical protein
MPLLKERENELKRLLPRTLEDSLGRGLGPGPSEVCKAGPSG